jgi:hypothetical protein
MVLTMHFKTYTLAISLFSLSIGACGDDDGGGSPPTTQQDAAISTPPTTSDAGTAVDAAVAMDAGLRPDAGPAVTLDGGRQDAAVIRDAGPRSFVDAGKDSAVPPAMSTPDAGPAKVDAGPATPPAVTLANSAACKQCESSKCIDRLDPAKPVDLTKLCSTLQGNATAGTQAGMAKSALCNAVLECARQTGCASPDYTSCLCGDLTFESCAPTDPAGTVVDLKGKCRDQIIAAAESFAFNDIAEQFQDVSTPLGAASTLLACGEAKCVNECHAPCSGKADGMSCDTVPNDVTARACTQGKCPDDYFYTDVQ